MDLQSIKHQVDLNFNVAKKNAHVLNEGDFIKQNTFISFETLHWLIKQAELVKEMDKMNTELLADTYYMNELIEDHKLLNKEIEKLEKQLDKLYRYAKKSETHNIDYKRLEAIYLGEEKSGKNEA